MDPAASKQQIVERVKQANNILVTVSANPSVDQLAACIGLTLLLNKMGKHATAVFSGQVPSTLEFLQPEKTIETNTDSLQDFIISLDKNKADKLRYKVEDKVVRIFITPYRSSLSEKDLIFSQGDFNVEVVMALGIKDRTQIDQAIAAHGRILHDATVISVNAGPGSAPQLGQLNWQDPAASSLSEMLVSISEAFGTGLIDGQMATAFLTGIVAETHRFSNNRTSPKVMTMAAQLMAAGANQQLIVSKLEPPPPMPPRVPPPPRAPAPITPPPKKDGALSVSHTKARTDEPEIVITPNEIHIDKQGNLKTAEDLKKATGSPKALEPPTPPPSPTLPEPVVIQPSKTVPELSQDHSLLNAAGHKADTTPPFNADMQSQWAGSYDNVSLDPLADGPNSTGFYPRPQTATSVSGTSATTPPLELDSARSAVQNAFASAPFDPGTAPALTSLNAQAVGPELHNQDPLANNDTPSLSLPSGTNSTISTTTPYMPPTNDMAPPTPPTMPPPLPLASNPGAMLPNLPQNH